MQVGISTASLFMRRNNEEALPLLDRLGVQTAEVFLTSLSEYGEDFARILKERKGGVFVNSVHILNSQIEPQLFSGHERVKGDSFALLDKVLSGAKLLGAPHYTFHGMARYKKSSRDPKNDNFEKIGLGLREISDFCQKYDVKLCLENVEWSTYNRPGVFERIAERVPTLGGVLDIKQARISGYPYELYLDEMGARIKTVHLSDIDENGKMCLPGKGSFDFETLIKRLQDYNFQGALLIEAYAQDYEKESELKTACEYLDELLYKLGK
jgi:sugar phosphate isomerase/epimerase